MNPSGCLEGHICARRVTVCGRAVCGFIRPCEASVASRESFRLPKRSFVPWKPGFVRPSQAWPARDQVSVRRDQAWSCRDEAWAAADQASFPCDHASSRADQASSARSRHGPLAGKLRLHATRLRFVVTNLGFPATKLRFPATRHGPDANMFGWHPKIPAPPAATPSAKRTHADARTRIAAVSWRKAGRFMAQARRLVWDHCTHDVAN